MNETDLLSAETTCQDLINEPQTNLEVVNTNTEKFSAIEQYTEQAIQEVQNDLIHNRNTGKGFKEGSKEIAHMVATAAAMNNADSDNEKFLEEIKHEKQEEIKQSFKSERYKEQAKTLGSKREKAEEFYNSFRPILEFDFSPLIPKTSRTIFFQKKPKKDKKGNIIQPTENNNSIQDTIEPIKPTYKDRSYGIPLMVMMLCLLTAPYCIITIILAVFNGINAVFDAIARFGKPALIICGSIVTIGILILVLYAGCLGVDQLFGTSIISTLFKH